ncbi:MAG: transposase, partial [Chromatiales bacterium]
MAMNKVQFQAGMSLSEFFEQFGTEQQCERSLEQARWPHGFVCPQCGGAHASQFSVGRTRYWQCSGCRHQTSLRSGTIFHSSKLP